MIAFGSCSVINDMQAPYMPDMVDMQRDMLQGFTEKANAFTDSSTIVLADSIDMDTLLPNQDAAFENMQKTMDKMFYMSDFTKTWMVRFGYIGAFVSLIYILGGVILLVKKNFSIGAVYAVLILSLLYSIAKGAVLAADESSGFIAMTTGFSQMFGIVVDMVFLVVISASDKSAYYLTVESEN